MHLINKNLALALSLQGRIKIEERDYDAASESFRKAISLDAGNPLLLLWDAYANYLKIEFSSGLKDEKYQERIASITRSLERAAKLSEKHGKKIRPHILYFLGYFYYKGKDIFTAKQRFTECIKECITLKKLKGQMEPSTSELLDSARELLDNIWTYQIRPPLWRWWWDSPLDNQRRRATFVTLSLFIFALLLLHPFISARFDSLHINWALYGLFVVLLLIILASPSIERIRTRDIEVEMHSPPPFEPILSPTIIEQRIEEMTKRYSEPELPR